MRIIIAAFLSICLIPTSYGYDKVKLMHSFFSTVMVRGYKDDGGLAYGSGVVVAKDEVLTNCHILRAVKKPWVSQGEDSYSITSVKADRWHDLCLVKAFNLPSSQVEIADTSSLKKGQQVIAIGHSSGLPAPTTSLGTVKSTFSVDQGHIVRSSARFALGASGSGLYDDNGRLIGINTFKTTGSFAYFYALPIEWLKQVEAQPDETVFPIIGKAFWEDDDDKKPFFMQVAVPEINQDWTKLKAVAEKWVSKEPNNTDALYELGFANEHLTGKISATEIYNKVLAIEPTHPETLFRLGVIAKNNGDTQKMINIKQQLAEVDENIAYEYEEQVINCKKECSKL